MKTGLEKFKGQPEHISNFDRNEWRVFKFVKPLLEYAFHETCNKVKRKVLKVSSNITITIRKGNIQR